MMRTLLSVLAAGLWAGCGPGGGAADSGSDTDVDTTADSTPDIAPEAAADPPSDTGSDTGDETIDGAGEPGPDDAIDITSGTPPTIDGTLGPGEWDDASSVTIEVRPGWTVTVLFMHGPSDLYFAFTGLVDGMDERYPEVLLDVQNDSTASWGADDWWLHASYNDCEGEGRPNDWSTCTSSATGWEANNFPLTSGVVEMRVSHAKIGLVPGAGRTLGIGFDVTDTSAEWAFWPTGADLDDPTTWGEATSSDGWE
ncbi:MAG: hypothetical protein JRG91_18235 [Deltaproteobacteria bacterium]|nr:hypothetical protein [Deltaproteobacteria bacterium]